MTNQISDLKLLISWFQKRPLYKGVVSPVKYAIIFFVLSGLVGLSPFRAQARRYRRVPINEQLKEELNGLLKAVNQMHQAFFDQNEEKIETTLQQVMVSIDKVDKKSALAETQKTHLKKMLSAAKVGIRLTKNTTGAERKESLRDAMKQLVQIAQTYDVDKYKVFFCPKDKAVWLQSGWKAKNPINPDRYAKCGKLVR